MQIVFSTFSRQLVLALALLAVLFADVSTAHAQSASCSRLQASLDQFSRSGDFQNFSNNDEMARRLAQAVQQAESQYIRTGCNDDARAGRTLTPQCQGIAREVLSLRDQYAQAANAVDTGNAMAQQREAILQELARFGCNANQGSTANFSNERQGLFDRIFGTSSDPNYGDGQMIENYDYWGYGGYSTVRSVCVRLSDGYFWPVSYSTLTDYLGQDAMTCQAMCPNEQVDLYFYDNPGQEPEQMRNLTGQPYTSLPTAFRYREAFDAETSCRQPVTGGTITVAESYDGSSRAMIDYNGVNFPLPLRDPRGYAQAPIATAALDNSQFVSVPLPRPRPAGPGEAPPPQAVSPPEGQTGLRLVQFGEKVVRVVGPDTPYAQLGAAGT